jgi:release factor glutamine methyltransferase
MTIHSWLDQHVTLLSAAGNATARLDCLVLLEDCLNKNRAQILAHPDLLLSVEQTNWLNKRIVRRSEHEPLAYIRGHTEFYGRTFLVDKHVLVPRPETEAMIDLTKKLLHNNLSISKTRPWKVADIGTGSGCIGITVALELPDAHVDLYDIDEAALAAARKNAAKHHVKISLFESDLLQNLSANYDVLLANLPYVPDGGLENIDASFEPEQALFAGVDGLDLYRKFWRQLKNMHLKPSYVLTESRPSSQQAALNDLAQAAGYKLLTSDQFIQIFGLI